MRAPALAAVRTRWPLPLAALLVAAMGRPFHVSALEWVGSDVQQIFGAIVYLGLVPLFAIAAGAAWLRCDLGGWAWALARPVSRRRWLAWVLVIDTAMLLASVGAGAWVLGPMPTRWIGPWSGDARAVAYLAILCTTYCAAALAGARRANTVTASSYVLAIGALSLAGSLLAEDAARRVPALLAALGHHHAANEFYGTGFDPFLPVELSMLGALLAIAVAALIAAGRSASRVPAHIGPIQWVMPLLVGTVVGAYGFPILLLISFLL